MNFGGTHSVHSRESYLESSAEKILIRKYRFHGSTNHAFKMSVGLKPKHLLSSYYVAGTFIMSFDPTTALGDRLLLSPLPFRDEEMKVRGRGDVYSW